MIRITQLKCKVGHTEEELIAAITKRARGNAPRSWRIVKKSIDARKKPDLYFVYTIDAVFENERLLLKDKKSGWKKAEVPVYRFPCKAGAPLERTRRPVIIGLGPAGLFAGLLLARGGFMPVIFERGDPVDIRTEKVEAFFETGKLDCESNVQFGEGGAGTFSDGKLNTVVNDKTGKNRFVLETLVRHGAPEEILYEAAPHIGTDRLKMVVASIREEILSLGGEIHFGAKLTELITTADGVSVADRASAADRSSAAGDEASSRYQAKLTGIRVEMRSLASAMEYPCEQVILAVGHSARDTFTMLHEKQTVITPKAFAIGLRAEHPAKMINISQYGDRYPDILPAAAYKLTHQCKNGRGVYSFCMCPGGHVIDASSEKGRLCVNGMSDSRRDGENSNSALVTTVTPEDFPGGHPLAGIAFQEKYEALAYEAAGGKIPVQLYGDFKENRVSTGCGDFTPSIKGRWQFADVRACLPEYVVSSLLEGMEAFGTRIRGFDREDTIFAGVETRTSSPVRILRDKNGQANIRGLYPCGEGAGYAGGILSAAMDGIRMAEKAAECILS